MSTFHSSSQATPMLSSVAEYVNSVELVDREMDIHTITLVLNGQHGEFDLVIEATDMDSMEEHRWTGVAHRSGGVAQFGEVKL